MNADFALFFEKIKDSFSQNTFVKLSLSRPRSASEGLKNVYLRRVLIKNSEKYSFTLRYNTKDETKNYDTEGALEMLENWIGKAFLNADLLTQKENCTLIFNKKGENPRLTIQKATHTEGGAVTAHNHEKKRLLDAKNMYFNALGVTDKQGNVLATGQKKFTQINKYIEILEAVLREKPLENGAFVADMGSGKGYLTFALYEHLTQNLGLDVQVEGFELRQNLVDFCNDLAQKSAFSKLNFVAQDIMTFESPRLDMLIALHACDTATDIAIAKGIKAGADIIVVAPCCHKQIRAQMQPQNALKPILKYGILLERQAEMLTDGIRALILEANGYKTKVFEFISTEHTPKNVMIVATKTPKINEQALAQVAALKQDFGIKYHALERLLD